MKICAFCHEEKPNEAFRLHPQNAPYLFSYCKKCENQKRWLRRLKKGVAAELWRHAKRRAEDQGLLFDITVEDIKVPLRCPVFEWVLLQNWHQHRPNSFTLDRIVPEFGYVKGNIQVLSHRANALKSNAKPEELAAILEKLYGWKCSPPVESPETGESQPPRVK